MPAAPTAPPLPGFQYTSVQVARLPNHDGTPRDARDRFFDLPDSDIGQLISASTSLGQHARKRSWGVTVIAGLLGALTLGALLAILCGGEAWTWSLVLAVALVVGWMAGPDPQCSYIGTRGARFVTRPLRLFIRRRVLVFDDAWEVRERWTRAFNQHGYGGTWVELTWVDDAERPVFTLKTNVCEHRIDREAFDFACLKRLPPDDPAVAGYAAIAAFHDFIARENAAIA
jgi:hypothetical protein